MYKYAVHTHYNSEKQIMKGDITHRHID